ncbi:MAG: hypothetical protein M1812_001199 [Candelaria pacifica]|nr:MAG: hypothetical protein M1812_001199 [Candelaria pacifica]
MALSPSTGLLDLEKELTCSICTDILYQPLTLLDCLHTFCGSCLKEWFNWQAVNPSSTHPFTCPSCRASVRDTRPDAKVTTLLEMFLQANPGKGKSEGEKETMKAVYKPGDNVMPKVEQRGEQEGEDEDRRLIEEVREMSLRETRQSSRGAQHAGNGSGRIHHRHRDDSRDLQPRDHHRSREQTEARNRRSDRGGTSPDNDRVSRNNHPSTPQAQARQIGHQSSLRSLLSSSDVDSSEMEEEILRQITEEGLLDGIDLSSIDVSQEDEISERIAEAYRRRLRERPRPQPARQDRSDRRRRDDQEHDEDSPQRRPHRRSQSAATGQTTSSRTRPASAHQAEDAPSSSARSRRRESSHSRRSAPQGLVPASRSSSDVSTVASGALAGVSGRQHSSEAARSRPAGSPHQRRSTTDPDSRITGLWRQGGTGNRSPRAVSQMPRSEITGRDTTRPVSSPSPNAAISSPRGPPTSSPNQSSIEQQSASERGNASHQRGSSLVSASNDSSLTPPSQQAIRAQVVQNDPSIQCQGCGKPHIEYELHYNCSQCDDGKYNLCLRCYRTGRGCRYWFGFGHGSWRKYEQLAPPGGYPPGHPVPHVMTAHSYLKPARSTNPPASGNSGLSAPNMDTQSRLQSGAFCDICLTYANECFWRCDICNQGEWGFCNRDVNQGRCCTHPLLPLAHISTINRNDSQVSGSPSNSALVPGQLPQAASVLRGPGVVDPGKFKPLTFSTKCDICTYPIQPSVTRYHCPLCNEGDYDICTSCYAKLVANGRISAENGHQGWRRCLKGHRMIVVGFDDRDGGQRRVVVRDLVGGTALKDQSADEASTEDWSWKDTSNGKSQSRTVTKAVFSSTGSANNGNALLTSNPLFPPDGGVGMRVAAMYSRYPEEGAVDELMFPKGAEVREVEDVNGEWYWGCYAGAKGLFPSNHVWILDSTAGT